MSTLHYNKTAQGREALRQRDQLNLRERQIMVMCNGMRSHEDLVGFFGPGAADVLKQLLARGLLTDSKEASPDSAKTSHREAGQDTGRDSGRDSGRDTGRDSGRDSASRPAPAPAPEPAPEPAPATHPQRVQAVREQALREHKPEVAEVIAQAAVARPDTQFGLSQIDSTLGAAPEELPPLSESELAALSEEPWARDPEPTPAPAPAPAPAPVSRPPVVAPATEALNWAMNKPVRERTVMEAKNFMTQTLLALEKPSALQLVTAHADVRHTVDVLLYLAQGLGCVFNLAGKQVATNIALRLSQRLPESALPMWLDCTLDHVPPDVSMTLYDQIMIRREAPDSV